MGFKNIPPHQELRAFVANKITFPLVVLELLKDGKDVDKETITKAIKELKTIVTSLDKEWRVNAFFS